jgi:hypothetical protein
VAGRVLSTSWVGPEHELQVVNAHNYGLSRWEGDLVLTSIKAKQTRCLAIPDKRLVIVAGAFNFASPEETGATS